MDGGAPAGGRAAHPREHRRRHKWAVGCLPRGVGIRGAGGFYRPRGVFNLDRAYRPGHRHASGAHRLDSRPARRGSMAGGCARPLWDVADHVARANHGARVHRGHRTGAAYRAPPRRVAHPEGQSPAVDLSQRLGAGVCPHGHAVRHRLAHRRRIDAHHARDRASTGAICHRLRRRALPESGRHRRASQCPHRRVGGGRASCGGPRVYAGGGAARPR